MTCINEYEVNIITEYNWIRDILNPYERTEILNSHQYPIMHGFMNTQQDRAKFNKFHILLDIRCTSKIIMKILIPKLNPKETLWCNDTHKRVILLPI